MMVLMASHDQKCHVAPYFSHPDLTNTKVPLIMLLVSLDADTIASGMM